MQQVQWVRRVRVGATGAPFRTHRTHCTHRTYCTRYRYRPRSARRRAHRSHGAARRASRPPHRSASTAVIFNIPGRPAVAGVPDRDRTRARASESSVAHRRDVSRLRCSRGVVGGIFSALAAACACNRTGTGRGRDDRRSPRLRAVFAERYGGQARTYASASAQARPNASADKPNAPIAPDTRVARNAPSPAPTPSRPASGAVRGAQTGSVLVRSTPADADVLVNGKLRGKTPLALRDLALGSYTIRVARDGYATEERTLQLTTRRPTTSTTINLRSSARAERFRSRRRRFGGQVGRQDWSRWTQRAITTGRCARVRQQSARRRDADRHSWPACGIRNGTHRNGWLPAVDDHGARQRGRADESRGVAGEKIDS